MSNVLELLSGKLLNPDLREGAKFFATSGNGHLKAAGSRSGAIAIWSESSPEVQYLSVQPVKRKKKGEAELQGLWLSQTGDLLFAASSVDVVAINTTSRTMAWDYQQKRQWGFLPSIPQGGYLSADDDLTTFYSSGEIIVLDRQSRVTNSETHPHTSRFFADAGDFAFGSDGHFIWKWAKTDGFGNRELIVQRACYSMAASGDGNTLAVRSTGRVFLANSAESTFDDEFAIDPGLPQMIVNYDGTQFGMLNEARVRFMNRQGELLGVFEVDEDFPISIHNSGDEVVVGMRSGRLFQLDWPS
ncbi:MAG: hypothetical protein ACKVQS_14145 [Fimbriimonadaceae bacterium]